ncbi:unnamed protein product [Allacma fusca]|uniref:Odorant receptor n=1 Tax=Allacma fusca TaxID=39272 RepID=A0A8J2KL48_9HEXA|nr:unnamed protein product [Allacma fusca]
MYVIPDTLIRLTQVFCTSELKELVVTLSSLVEQCKTKIIQGTGFVVASFILILNLCLVLFAIWEDDLNSFGNPNFKLTFFTEKALILVYIIGDAASFSMIMYAYLFVTTFGVVILNVYEQLMEEFDVNYLRGDFSIESKEIAWSLHKSLDEFTKQLFALKRVMDIYSKIGSIYILALIYHSAVNLFRLLNAISNKNEVSFLINSMALNVYCVVSLVYIAYFGNHLSQRAQEIKENILAANVLAETLSHGKISKLLSWLPTWDWKLSAFEMCAVNHTIIPTLVILFLFLCISSDVLTSNSLEVVLQSSKLSDHITFALVYSMYVIPDTLIRLTQGFCTSELKELVVTLSSLVEQCKTKIIQGTGFVVVSFILILNLSFILYEVSEDDSHGFANPNFKLTYFNHKLLTVIYVFLDATSYTAIMNAYLFVTTFGVIILNVYEQLVKKLGVIYLRGDFETESKAVAWSQSKWLDGCTKQLFALRRVMDIYSKVGGIYILAIIYHSAVNLFRLLNSISNQNDVALLVNSKALNIFSVVSLGFIAYFGNFLSKRSQEIKQNILATHVLARPLRHDEISKLLCWILTWDFKLSAFDMCDVTHAIIPTVISSIFPCMILIFQLRLSENEEI